MKSIKVVTLSVLFVVSFITVGYLVARGHKQQGNQGFTLYMTQTSYPPTREPILTANKVRYQKGDGSWKLETTYSNGRKDDGFGQPARGVFHVDEKNRRLDYLSESGVYAPTEEQLRNNPGFVGEEVILGYKTFHIHTVSEINSDDYVDSYVCLALQGYPIKSVSGSKNGFKTVFETTKVILGEPSFQVPAYPVDMGRYNQIHGTTASSPQ
jgi:hypothetical protein